MPPKVPLHPVHLHVRDLGRMDYARALDLQRTLHAEVVAHRDDPEHGGILLLVEHDPPVITITRRPGARDHLLATPAMLDRAGVVVHETDRGGDITFHGPGQLVVYPILDLNRLHLRLHGYMRWLEKRVLDVLSHFNIAGKRDDTATGVWVDSPAGTRKICALGVRVSRWVSMHGLALNVDPDLSHFDLIVPCGLHGRSVTSIRSELGDDAPDMDRVKQVLVESFIDATRHENHQST